MKEWNGEFRSLVIGKAAHPELFAELANYSNRDRTNRLRTLAMLGLFALQMRGHLGTQDAEPSSLNGIDAGKKASTQPGVETDTRREKIKDKMLGSIS